MSETKQSPREAVPHRDRKPYVEHLTVRLDEDLLADLEQEALRRENEAGVRISRGEIARMLLRVGLDVVRIERERRAGLGTGTHAL